MKKAATQLTKSSPTTQHTNAPKSGKVTRVAHITLHTKHNKGVTQPYIAAGK